MTARERRPLRLALIVSLLVSLPLTGFLWAMPSAVLTLGGGALLAAVSVALALTSEMLAATTDAELHRIEASAAEVMRGLSDELAAQKEAVRELDRRADAISGQNHALRHKLLRERMRQAEEGLVTLAAPDAPSRPTPYMLQAPARLARSAPAGRLSIDA